MLNTTHQLRLSSPGSFAAQGNVFLTGPEALVFGRMGAIALRPLPARCTGALHAGSAGARAWAWGTSN